MIFMSTVTNAVFTSLSGCLVEIDGWQAEIDTKQSILLRGMCIVKAVDFDFTKHADRLMTCHVADWDNYACDDPVIVDLAMRYRDWSNDDQHRPWPDTPVEVARDSLTAFYSMMAWITGVRSAEHGEPVMIFSERLDLQHHRAMAEWASEQEAQRQAEGRPRLPLFPPDSQA